MPDQRVLKEINKDVLRAMNQEVSVRARRFSDQLLFGVFRALFHVERSFEFAEPEVFQVEHDPERIAWSRLDDYRLKHLSVAIANGEVRANRYQLFTEYDFIVLADVSRSMMLHWGAVYDVPGVLTATPDQVKLRASKLYFLKYVLVSFLHAAKRNGFTRSVKLFGADRIRTYLSKDDANLEESLLSHIDGHFHEVAKASQPEAPTLPAVLRETLERKKRCIVLCVSDFADGVGLLGQGMRFQKARMGLADFLPCLAELAYRHKLLVFQIREMAERLVVQMGQRAVDPDNPYYDMESDPTLLDKAGRGKINAEWSRKVGKQEAAWHEQLSGAVASRGIDFESFEAGSLASIDKAIYRLGLVTGV